MKSNSLPNPYQNIPSNYLNFLYTESHRKIKALLQDLTHLYGAFHVSLNFFQSQKKLVSMLIPIDLESLIMHKETLEDCQRSEDSIMKYNPSNFNLRLNDRNRIFCGRKSLLNQEQQRQVGMLCAECFDNGEILTFDKLCNFAKSVSKSSTFTVSVGWAQNFLKKHPSIKEIFYKSKQRFNDSKSVRSNLSRTPVNWPIFENVPRKIDYEHDYEQGESKMNEKINTLYGEQDDMSSSSQSLDYCELDE